MLEFKAPDELETKVTRIYALIGEIAVAWNFLDMEWYGIFFAFMRGTDHGLIESIFFRMNGGAAQRELVMDVAKGMFGPGPHDWGSGTNLLQRLIDLKTETQKLAIFRNGAVHSPYDFIYSATAPDFVMCPGMGSKSNPLLGKQNLIAALEAITPKIR